MSSGFELEQVRVSLTQDKEILSMLKTRKQFKKDKDGEYLPVVFNSSEIKFRPGRPLTVGRNVAECLVRSSYVIIGDDLTGDMVPALEALDGYNLDKFIEEGPVCEFCDKSFQTARALAHHMGRDHREQLEGPKDEKPAIPETAKVATAVAELKK